MQVFNFVRLFQSSVFIYYICHIKNLNKQILNNLLSFKKIYCWIMAELLLCLTEQHDKATLTLYLWALLNFKPDGKNRSLPTCLTYSLQVHSIFHLYRNALLSSQYLITCIMEKQYRRKKEKDRSMESYLYSLWIPYSLS
jgi:hypothetical protein